MQPYRLFLLDFTSLYPHIMIQTNLSNRKKDLTIDDGLPTWNGGGVWKVDGIYYANELSNIEKLRIKLFYLRMYFKRKFVLADEKKVVKMKDAHKYTGKNIYVTNTKDIKDLELKTIILTQELTDEYLELSKKDDKKEYSCKISLNTGYGILDTPYYSLVYDKIAAQDCTQLGEQWIKYARKVFKDNGYDVVYTDTDSIYLLDFFNDMDKLLSIKNQIIDYIKSTVPFPQLTFDMDLEAEIKHLFFFKGKDNNKIEPNLEHDDLINKKLGLMKKNYIYVKKGEFKEPKDALVIKNLGIRKKSVSPLSRKIFWDHLVPQIVNDGIAKFSRTYIKNLIIELLQKDLTLICFRKNVKSVQDYKDSPIQAQISQKYGPGVHFLIPNLKNLGVGKSVKLCSLEEFKERKMSIADIDLKNVWSELDYFIKPVITKNIFDFV